MAIPNECLLRCGFSQLHGIFLFVSILTLCAFAKGIFLINLTYKRVWKMKN